MKPLHLLSLMPRLRDRDVHELAGMMREASLEEFAVRRSIAPGVAWAVLVDGVVVGCGGALEGLVAGVGTFWMLGAKGCERHIKHALRIWRVMVQHGGYRRLECKCYDDNRLANEFAQHLGFKFEGTLRGYTLRGEDVNQYGMVLGGANGR